MQIGFLAQPEQRVESGKPAERCMLTFDSGRGITFPDAKHHLIGCGTTGVGKTTCYFLPCTRHLLENNHCGLLVDIKGNVRRQVRALAHSCGRDGDIVEYGSAPTATPLNILQGMDRYAMYEFFKTLTIQSFQGSSQSLDWHMRGVGVAADCGQLLLYLNGLDPMFSPDVVTIAAMLNNPAKALELYKLFKARVYDSQDEEQSLFVNAVDSNRFHVLRERMGDKNSKTAIEDDQQMTWNLQGVRQALKTFLDAPGICDNFAAPGGPGLDMRHILRENKVAILRFGLDTGPIGVSLARAILSDYYAAVYELGMSLPAGKKCFVCIDEYQEVADLSNDRFSDVSFVAQAREFNAIFLASTQSMSALMHRSFNPAAVEALTSNCNGRVVFYSDDPMTQAMVARYEPGLDLKTLRPGEAFVIRYENAGRRHLHGTETLQEEFESTRAIIEGAKTEENPVRPAPAVERHSLSELAAWAQANKQPQIETAPGVNPGETHGDRNPNQKNIQPQRVCPVKEAPMTRNYNQNGIMEKFPDFFVDEEVSISVPAGWLDFAEHALTAFRASGLRVRLTSLSLEGNALCASEGKGDGFRHRSESGALRLLNKLLQGSGKICALCGERMTSPVAEAKSRERDMYGDDDDDSCESDTLPICGKCLQKYELTFSSEAPNPAK